MKELRLLLWIVFPSGRPWLRVPQPEVGGSILNPLHMTKCPFDRTLISKLLSSVCELVNKKTTVKSFGKKSYHWLILKVDQNLAHEASK